MTLKECGLSFFTPNVRMLSNKRILGGYEAWPNSWPSMAFIVFTYQAQVNIPNTSAVISIGRTFVCAGTLICRRTSNFSFFTNSDVIL